MKYLVMECHPAYAVVLDQEGRFLHVANQNFAVGQSVESVVAIKNVQKSTARIWRTVAAVAACLCLLLVGTWQGLIVPYGSVRIQINPDVKLTVNRLDRVIAAEPLNTDAEALLAGYEPQMQKVDQVADALADRAQSMGFLKDGGQIQVTVESTHGKWRAATEDRLILELQMYTNEQIMIVPSTEPIPERSWVDDNDWDDDDEPDDDMDDGEPDDAPDDEEDGDDDDHDGDGDSDEDDDDPDDDDEDPDNDD